MDSTNLLHNGGGERQGELRVIWVEDVRQREICGVHHPICDGPDAVPSSEVFYPKRYLFKNSICWNGPWNMSAVAEGSLAVLELAVWLWGSCAVSCTPWAERGREVLLWQSDSRAMAAAACTISLRTQEGEEGGQRKKERERFYHNMEPMLLNVSVVGRLQITSSSECHKRCHMHTAATLSVLDEKVMVSKHMDRCFTGWSDAREKQSQ